MLQCPVGKLVHACKLDNQKLQTYWLNYSMRAKIGCTQYSSQVSTPMLRLLQAQQCVHKTSGPATLACFSE